MPTLHFLALWTVLNDLQTEHLETFSRWLLVVRDLPEHPEEEGPLKSWMTAALKLPREEQAQLSDFLLGALEARYAE
ncbi:MAG: hypothetical protein GIW97_00865 [Candidatus Eremiobacteraeota bacterium]|nr:hypothetical protein [Candidatus Eremiobacteraeota bacterium]